MNKPKAVREIITRLHRNDKGEVDGYYAAPAVPGQMVERCGKIYQIQPNGSQKRIS